MACGCPLVVSGLPERVHSDTCLGQTPALLCCGPTLSARIIFLVAGGRGVSGDAAPTSVQLADGSSVTRRIIDSDNSCLFNAVGGRKGGGDLGLSVIFCDKVSDPV